MKFYLKIATRNFVFYLYILFYIFLLYSQHSALEISVQHFTIVNLFSIIASNVYSLVLSCKIVSNNYELISFYEKSEFETYKITIKTMFIISILTSVLSIVTIILFANRDISNIYILKGILNFFVLWNISNILSSTIGATFSKLLSKKIAILISLSIYILFVIEVYNSSMSTLGKLLNIFDDSTSIIENILAQEIFNFAYILDKIFIVFLVLLMVLIVRFRLINKNRYKYLLGIFISIICIISTVFMAEKSVSYTSIDIAELEKLEYEIESYEMNVEINTILKNSANINMKVNSNISEINLLLDDTFKINKVEINNKETYFTHENDVIKILYDAAKSDDLEIEIDYSGSVHVENNIGVDMYYVDITTINLPGNSFFWYPTLNNNLDSNYIVNISCFSSLFSNLNISNMTDYKFHKKYTLTGISSGVDLFAGDYKTVKKDGIEYVIPSTDNIDVFINNLNSRISNIISNPDFYNISEEEIEELKNYNYKKVIVGVWESNDMNYNNVLRFKNDTLIINYF